MLSQKTLLEATDSRRILDQVKDDSSSLIGLRDADSCVSLSTKSTGRSSLLSKIFAFDSELMGSNVYQKQTRSLMKIAIRTPERAHRLNHAERKKFAKRSAVIEQQLRRDRKSQAREVRVVIQGSNQGRLALMVKLIALYGTPYRKEERLALCAALQRRVVNSILSCTNKPAIFGTS